MIFSYYYNRRRSRQFLSLFVLCLYLVQLFGFSVTDFEPSSVDVVVAAADGLVGGVGAAPVGPPHAGEAEDVAEHTAVVIAIRRRSRCGAVTAAFKTNPCLGGHFHRGIWKGRPWVGKYYCSKEL